MPGLDKILSTIEAQAKQTAGSIVSQAEQKSASIRSEGEKKAQSAYDAVLERCRRNCSFKYESSCNSIDSEMKRELLRCRIECIDKAAETALERVASLPDDEYFAVILRLAEKYMRKGSGVLYFGKKDLSRLPSGFEKSLNILAETRGSTIEISPEPADIADGFILRYGNISENCSFRAIAEAEKNNIRDTAAAVMFER